MKANKIKKLEKEEYNHLINCLSIRGARSDYANIINKTPSYVTRMINRFKVYNISTQEWETVYGIYEHEYDTLIEFIKTIK